MQPPRALLENCRNNDRKAHHDLYVMCFPLLYSICSRYHINDEDRKSALNLIFLKLVTNMHAYLHKAELVPFEQWMRRIAVNHVIDEFRRQKRYRETILLHDETPDEHHPLIGEDPADIDMDLLHRALSSLPPASRTVFNLFAVEGYRHEEISSMLGISVGTSKAHVFKARKRLQELLPSNLSYEKRILS
ncbi:MAG: sigma-70 family RNA polymerase sigma factor [Sphingobacteriales bacterium]|jgi:RNA polymerase sigma factor (sigma-70 family)|nr:sigma-70 family RNA polymerase sigma factor [Sphingobacteriales bacterium]